MNFGIGGMSPFGFPGGVSPLNSFGGLTSMGAMTPNVGINLSFSINLGGDVSNLSPDKNDPYSSIGNLSSMFGNAGMNPLNSMGLGMVPGFGGAVSPAGSMFGGQAQNNQMMLMLMMMMQMMMMLQMMMQQQMMGETGMAGGLPIGASGGGYGGGLPIGASGGGYGGGSGSYPVGSSGAMSGTSPSTSNNEAVALAQKYLGRDSASLKGELPHFTAAGGRNNNCVDFVSSLLESTGKLKNHYINVKAFEKGLIAEGFRQVPASQAQPGDVWINDSRGHTEIVEKAGNPPTLIGSNNNGDSIQEITRDTGSARSGVFYHKD